MNQQKRNEIIGRWQAGASIRKIARALGLARNTVSKVLSQVQARREGDALQSPPRRRVRQLDRREPFLQELVARYPEFTAVRLWEELRQQGFAGGDTMVRQRLAELRPGSPPPPCSASSNTRTWRPRCASTRGPSLIWAMWRRLACTTI